MGYHGRSVIAGLASSLVLGVLAALAGAELRETLAESLFVIVSFMTIGTLTFYWMRHDSGAHNMRHYRWWAAGFIVGPFTIVAVPAYFLKSRGLRGGLAAMAAFLLVVIGCSGTLLAGASLATVWLPATS